MTDSIEALLSAYERGACSRRHFIAAISSLVSVPTIAAARPQMEAGAPFVPRGINHVTIKVRDLNKSRHFYERLFVFPVMESDTRFCAYNVAPGAVFLLFERGKTLEPVRLPFGVIPPHDASGHMHMAFAIPQDQLAAWRERLSNFQIPIESEVKWPRGGTSVYFRDPDGHLLELATPGLWANY